MVRQSQQHVVLHVSATYDPTTAMEVQVNATRFALGWQKLTQTQGACWPIDGSCAGTLTENHRRKYACPLALVLAKCGRANLLPLWHGSHRLGDLCVSLLNFWWDVARVQQGRIRVGVHDMQWVCNKGTKRANDRLTRSWIETISSIANWPT
jgi:hypothetical protein